MSHQLQPYFESAILLGTIALVIVIAKVTNWIINRNTLPPRRWWRVSNPKWTAQDSSQKLKDELERAERERTLAWMQSLKFKHEEFANLDFFIEAQKINLGLRLRTGQYKSYADYCNDFDKLMEEKERRYNEINERYRLNPGVR